MKVTCLVLSPARHCLNGVSLTALEISHLASPEDLRLLRRFIKCNRFISDRVFKLMGKITGCNPGFKRFSIHLKKRKVGLNVTSTFRA